MAAIPVNVKQNIDKMYDKQRETQLQKLRESQQKATSEINLQKKQTDRDYYNKRNQADVVNIQSQRSLRERMAALGQTSANISGQIALQSSRQNTLGSLNERTRVGIRMT